MFLLGLELLFLLDFAEQVAVLLRDDLLSRLSDHLLHYFVHLLVQAYWLVIGSRPTHLIDFLFEFFFFDSYSVFTSLRQYLVELVCFMVHHMATCR